LSSAELQLGCAVGVHADGDIAIHVRFSVGLEARATADLEIGATMHLVFCWGKKS